MKKKLGVHVSDKCKTVVPNGKDWFEFRLFVKTFWKLLSEYTLVVSETTAIILAEVERDLKRQGEQPLWDLEVSSNSRVLKNKLVAASKEEIERILLFLDPEKLESEMASLWILRETVVEHGQKMNINLGAILWAERQWKTQQGIDSRFSIGADDAIVLLRQNSSRAIDRFALSHLDKVMLFPRLIFTGRTRASITEFVEAAKASASLTREAYDRMQAIAALLGDLRNGQDEIGGKCHLIACAGRSEKMDRVYLTEKIWDGMQDIASLLVTKYSNKGPGKIADRLCHVIACPGHNPGRTEVKALENLIRVCADPHMRVNLVLNQETAEDWMQLAV